METSTQEPEPKKLKMSTTTSDDEPTNPTTNPLKPRYKRRKVAIFLAYCGVGYQGMQKNPGAKTIEGDLEEALYQSGAVPEADRGNPKKWDFARSARTDKGVSAVGQVVSGRFYVDPPGFIDRLNSNLNGQIRAFGFKRVTNSFSAKKFCDRRRYVYLIPVFAFDANAHPDRESVKASLGSENELVKCVVCSDRGRKVYGVMGRGQQNNVSRIMESNDVMGSQQNNISRTMESNAVMGSQQNNLSRTMESNVVNTVESESMLCLDSMGSQQNNVSRIIDVDVDVVMGSQQNNESRTIDDVCAVNADVSEFGLCLDSNGVAVSGSENVVVEESVTEEESRKLDLSVVEGNGVVAKGDEYRYGEGEKERFNRILSHYVGTHNFHNFTTRTKAEDPAAKRFIVSFNANHVVNVQGMDFIKCEVVGQSFMLHQIRKMMGLAVAIMRNCAPEALIETALQQDVNITVPTAPEVGLFLEECFFTSYNQKWTDTHEEISMKDYAEASEEFKMKQVYSHIASTEQKEGSVAIWLHSLNYRNYPDLRYLSSKGSSANGERAQAESLVPDLPLGDTNGTLANGESAQAESLVPDLPLRETKGTLANGVSAQAESLVPDLPLGDTSKGTLANGVSAQTESLVSDLPLGDAKGTLRNEVSAQGESIAPDVLSADTKEILMNGENVQVEALLQKRDA